MLSFTPAQYGRLEALAFERFVGEMTAHLGARAPALRATLSDADAEVCVRAALDEGRARGFALRGPLRLWLDLRIAFGSGATADPLHAGWIEAALAAVDPDPGLEMARAESLYRAILQAQARIHGPDDAATRAALARLLEWARAERRLDPAAWPAAALDAMAALHPEKAAWAGDAALAALAARAEVAADGFGAPGPRPRMLTAALMFAFGAGCLDDPLYPWIGRTLGDPRVASPAARLDRLERKATTWLAAVVARQAG